jgi:hypothetical protein
VCSDSNPGGEGKVLRSKGGQNQQRTTTHTRSVIRPPTTASGHFSYALRRALSYKEVLVFSWPVKWGSKILRGEVMGHTTTRINERPGGSILW